MQIEESNIHAIKDYKETKRLTFNDLKAIKPLNAPQRQMFESYFYDNFILANGSAGTGKTYAAIYLGLTDVLTKKSKQTHMIIVRSAVASRDIGFLPGTDEEKMEPYEAPYRDIFADLFGRETAYDKMKKQKLVKFMASSFVRGLTWDNAVVIIDEIQNMTFYEINSVITRLGANSKLVIIGDQIQTDLYRKANDKSGMSDFLKVVERMDNFDEVTFTSADIVRSAFVKSWICAMEDAGVTPS
jgi:phosphate starvation-inducible PhoH-like protein